MVVTLVAFLAAETSGGWTGSLATTSDLPEPFGRGSEAQTYQQAGARTELVNHVLVQESDRQRIARDLHDEVGHRIAAAMLRLDIACQEPGCAALLQGHLASVRQLLVESVDSLHEVAFRLRPQILDDLGLVPAFRSLARRAREATGIQIDVWANTDMPRISIAVELAAFRIAQEALTNSIKHAEAKRIDITLGCTDTTAHLSISDDGIGIHRDRAADPARDRLGLRSMRERAELVGGYFQIDSCPGRGTTIGAWFPVSEVGL